MDGKHERRIVEGEMFGAPAPGRWPGGEGPMGEEESAEPAPGPRRRGRWRRFLELIRAVPR
jgi:hypothetical protein